MNQRFKFAVLFASVIAASAGAAVSEEEARQLGTTLTLFGAEKAGNKEGTIPAYEGGLPTSTAPAGFRKGSGKWVNPFAAEKPLYSITGQNVDKYASKLSQVNIALLKRNPDFRIDVYPTHRTAAYPQYILDKTVRNATAAKTIKGGIAIEGAIGGIPFPLPKTGYEVMWNHMTRYSGLASEYWMRNFYIDNNGKVVNSGELKLIANYAFHNPKATAESVQKDDAFFSQTAYNFTGPPRSVGDATTYFETIDPTVMPRRAYTYSASTRRVRLGPDIAYDTPIASQGGVTTYDDANLYQNKMDRFDFKLVGKREMLIPYSIYDLSFNLPSDKVLGPRFVNPDHTRWELHRVWVVEATLKPGFRHLYSKRVFYFDEDWTGAGMSDEYDAAGKLYKGLFQGVTQLYDRQIPLSQTYWAYDLSTGVYSMSQLMGDRDFGWQVRDTLYPKMQFSPEGLQARSGR